MRDCNSRLCGSPGDWTRPAPALDLDRRGLVRQRPRRDDQRSLQTGCVYAAGWDDDELELATLSWVHWFNEERLHSHCGDVPPAESEAAHDATRQATPAGVGNQ